MPDLDSQTINMSKLFSQDFFFSIPDYQRPFSWDSDNLADLIDDLIGAPWDADYFLGTLVLHQTGDATYDVVDGQQRLTALCILIACLRDTASLNGDIELQNMLVQPDRPLAGIQAKNRLAVKDVAVFNKVVGVNGGTSDPAALDERIGNGERRYREAVSIFHNRLSALTDDQVRGLAAFLIQHCVVIYLAAKSFADAFRLFTIVNDRGKQLRRIDILKAQNLAPDVIGDDDLRSQYARTWEAMEEEIGEADFEDIFSSLRLIYVQEKPQGDLLDEFNKRIFGKPQRPNRGTQFIDVLGEYVELYDSLFVARDYLDSTPDAARFTTLMTIMVGEFRASEWRACLLQYAKRFGNSGLMTFLLRLEKVYMQHWVEGMRKDERYSVYTDILKAVGVCRTGDDAASQMTFDLNVIEEGCRVKNFYSVGYARYLLLRAEILASELTEPRIFRAKSVEHVLPQNPTADSKWRKEFTQDDIDAVIHLAGNLVLLSKSKNSSAQNKEFPNKKTSYLEPRVTDFPRSVQVISVDSWTRSLIEHRTEEFATTVLRDP
jgi:hypothetical protein